MANPRERILASLNELFDMPVASRFGYESAVMDAITIVERELPESQWQPIETAPTGYLMVYGRGYGIERRYCIGHKLADQGFTHWMPLLEPPEVSDE